MLSPAITEALASPAAALAALFRPEDPTDAFPQKVTAYFSHLFSTDAAFGLIPALGPEPHPPLVAFCAVVQDTSPSPHIYLARLPNDQPGGWGFTSPAPLHGSYSDLRQATVLWATSVPGLAPWCSDHTPRPMAHKPTRPHKFPLPGVPHIGVQVKIYDPRLAEGLRPSDLSTFVGILTDEPLHTDDLESLETDDTVPTLHLLFTRPTPPTIIPRSFPASYTPDGLQKTRDSLLTWIAEEGLGGDKDAAEWVLLSAIARTQAKTPPIYPPSLTLSSFPPPSHTSPTPTLYHLLSLILPITNILPLSLDTLNNTSFSPHSINEDLHSGWLQVPQGSLYLITESGVTEGNVLDKGIQNLRAVQGMITAQTLDYLFPFSRFTFPTDVTFVVLTQGKKSAFFQTSINVPLKPNRHDLYKSPDNVKLPDDAILNQWRTLIGASKIGSVTVNDETAQYIQDDFVNERKAATSNITSDVLVQRMITARLLALSYHETVVTTDIWEKAKVLDANRMARTQV